MVWRAGGGDRTVPVPYFVVAHLSLLAAPVFTGDAIEIGAGGQSQ
jgi:hypothetical protein